MGKTHRKPDTLLSNEHQEISDDKSFDTPKPIYKIVGHARVSKSGNALSLKLDEGLIPRYFVISKRNLTDLFIGKEIVIQIREYEGINKPSTNGDEVFGV